MVSEPVPVSNSTNTPNKKLKILSDIKAFVKTTSNEKQALDAPVACFVYATNSSFNLVEKEEFLKLIALLHLGNRPPSFRTIASELLEHLYDQVYGACKEKVGARPLPHRIKFAPPKKTLDFFINYKNNNNFSYQTL